jgi:hypothetical protein
MTSKDSRPRKMKAEDEINLTADELSSSLRSQSPCAQRAVSILFPRDEL